MEEAIWVGGLPTPGRLRVLIRDHRVTRFICLTAESEPDVAMREAGDVLWLPTPDFGAPTPQQLRDGCDFLAAGRADRRVTLLYCGSGVGRAPTLYAAWCISSKSESVELVLSTMRAARPVVALTQVQMQALRAWARGVQRG